MKKGGAGFYAKQGWTGGEGIWSWRAEVPGLEGAGEAPGQGPALAGGSGEAQAGGKAVTAVSEGAAAVVVLERRRMRLQEWWHQRRY